MFNHYTKEAINIINEDICYSEKTVKKYQFSKMCDIHGMLPQTHCARQGECSWAVIEKKDLSVVTSMPEKAQVAKKSQSVKHFPTWRQRAMVAQGRAMCPTTEAQTCFSNQCSKNKIQNYHPNHLSTILFFTTVRSMLMYIRG